MGNGGGGFGERNKISEINVPGALIEVCKGGVRILRREETCSHFSFP